MSVLYIRDGQGNFVGIPTIKGDKGDQGDPGTGLVVLGLYATLADLIAAHPTGNVGDVYAVGDETDNVMYLWSGTEWKNIGALQGPPGPQGEQGIQGEKGDQGDPTTVNGKTGASITLSKSDIGLGSVDNVRQYSSSNPPPYPVTSVNGQTGAVTIQTGASTWGEVTGKPFSTVGSGLKVESNTLSVDTATSAVQGNTKPITSGAVYDILGNIEAMLATI